MPLTYEDLILPALVGAGDIVLDEYKPATAYLGPMDAQDIVRTLEVPGVWLANMGGYIDDDLADNLVKSSTPLFMKSAWKVIKHYTTTPTARGRGRTGLERVRETGGGRRQRSGRNIRYV